MKPLDDFLPQILPFAPGCPVPVAHSYIRSAAITMSRRARIWRESDTFPTVAGRAESYLCVPDGAVIYEIESVIDADGAALIPASKAMLDSIWPRWRDADSGRPKYYLQEAMNGLVILPGDGTNVTVEMFLQPSEDCDQLPDFFADQYRRTIAAGALAEILMLPKQNFSDPNAAAVHAMRFAADIDRLTGHEMRGQQRAPKRTRAQFM